MTIVINAAANLLSPKSDPLEWCACQNLGGKHAATGDLYEFRGNSSVTPKQLYTSIDNGLHWTLIAADATNPYTGTVHGMMSLDQDVTNGAVHVVLYDTGGITNARGYGRIAFNVANGHIVSYTWQATPFALTTHTSASFDPRATINIFTFGGVENIVYLIGLGTTSGSDLVYYAGKSTTLTPASSSDFAGLDGTGSDSLMINLADATQVRSNHTCCAAFSQNKTTEDVVLFMGHIFSGDTLASPSGSLSDVWYKLCAKGGSGWTVPTATTAGTAIVSTNGSTAPNICAVFSHTNGAYINYNDPANGVKVAYVTSTPSVTTLSGSPLSTINRGGYGVFTVDSSGNVYLIYKTLGISSVSPVCGEVSYFSSTWTNTNDTATDNVCAIFGAVGWTSGCFALFIEGDAVAQTVTGIVNAASIYTATGPYIIVQPANQIQKVNTQAIFTVSAEASAGSLSYQWEIDNGSGYVNVGSSLATYTTQSLQLNNTANVKVVVTDSAGAVTSSVASLSIYQDIYTNMLMLLKRRKRLGSRFMTDIREWF